MWKILLAVLISVNGAAASWEYPIEYVEGSDDIHKVVVDSPVGTIDVRSSANDSIYAEVTKIVDVSNKDEADELAHLLWVDFEKEKSSLGVTVDFSGVPRNKRDKLDIAIKLRVPASDGLEIRTASANVSTIGSKSNIGVASASGNVSIDSLTGTAEVKSASGYIRITNVEGSVQINGASSSSRMDNINGEIEAKTASGDAMISNSAGRLRIRTASGNINVQGFEGQLETVTISGKIAVDSLAGSLQASSTSGEIDVAHFVASDGSIRAETVSGDVLLRIPSLYRGSIDLESMSGNIDSDLNLTSSHTYSRKHLQGRTGEGTGLIDVRTTSGDIMVETY